jgi:hypothetical protein
MKELMLNSYSIQKLRFSKFFPNPTKKINKTRQNTRNFLTTTIDFVGLHSTKRKNI